MQHILLKGSKGSLIQIELDNITHIEAEQKICKFFLLKPIDSGEELYGFDLLKGYSDKLKEFPNFVRIGESIIVNIIHVSKYVCADEKYLIMKSNKLVRVRKDITKAEIVELILKML